MNKINDVIASLVNVRGAISEAARFASSCPSGVVAAAEIARNSLSQAIRDLESLHDDRIEGIVDGLIGDD